jgi:hypothetical protein
MQALHTFWQLDFRSFFLVNQAYMILLRKKLDAVCVQDFGSIHSMSKLITKTPWMRLAPHISSLVMPNQSAFINGCVLHDNFRTVQLSAKSLHAQRFPAVLLKIDIAKAFDTAHGLHTEMDQLDVSAGTRILLNGTGGGGHLSRSWAAPR